MNPCRMEIAIQLAIIIIHSSYSTGIIFRQ